MGCGIDRAETTGGMVSRDSKGRKDCAGVGVNRKRGRKWTLRTNSVMGSDTYRLILEEGKLYIIDYK
jgi:hypothetical protein